jgi:asparagine synthase (glutamine-hydrolysing)
MCGFSGFLDPTRRLDPGMRHRIARRMAAALEPRGPDDEDVWTDGEAGMALAFRRFAVIDLSVSGRQSMHSADGRFVLAFNGEVYNHEELRADLQSSYSCRPRGHPDS